MCSQHLNRWRLIKTEECARTHDSISRHCWTQYVHLVTCRSFAVCSPVCVSGKTFCVSAYPCSSQHTHTPSPLTQSNPHISTRHTYTPSPLTQSNLHISTRHTYTPSPLTHSHIHPHHHTSTRLPHTLVCCVRVPFKRL